MKGWMGEGEGRGGGWKWSRRCWGRVRVVWEGAFLRGGAGAREEGRLWM